jgi:hypothetical protein
MERLAMRGESMIPPEIIARIAGVMGELAVTDAECDNGRASMGYGYKCNFDALCRSDCVKTLKISESEAIYTE